MTYFNLSDSQYSHLQNGDNEDGENIYKLSMAGFGPGKPRACRTAPRHLRLRDLPVSLPSPPGCLLETMSSDIGASPKPRCQRTDGPTSLGA